jgi:hypothetical protein
VAERPDLPGLTEHEVRNRASWNAFSDEYQAQHAEALDPRGELRWGTYGIPESELHVLGPIEGRDILELGCGAAQWSISLANGEDVAFQLPYGDWIRLFRAHGFLIEDLIEPRPPADARSTFRNADERAWARRWPAECIWRLRRER